jgi:hypothetical protein
MDSTTSSDRVNTLRQWQKHAFAMVIAVPKNFALLHRTARMRRSRNFIS